MASHSAFCFLYATAVRRFRKEAAQLVSSAPGAYRNLTRTAFMEHRRNIILAQNYAVTGSRGISTGSRETIFTMIPHPRKFPWASRAALSPEGAVRGAYKLAEDGCSASWELNAYILSSYVAFIYELDRYALNMPVIDPRSERCDTTHRARSSSCKTSRVGWWAPLLMTFGIA